jgi:hypothetical protein
MRGFRFYMQESLDAIKTYSRSFVKGRGIYAANKETKVSLLVQRTMQAPVDSPMSSRNDWNSAG